MTVIDVWNREFSTRLDVLDVGEIERIPIQLQRGRREWPCIGRRITISADRHPILCEHLQFWASGAEIRFVIHGDEAFAFVVNSAQWSPGGPMTVDLVAFIDQMRASILPPNDEARSLL
ncbi:hypothetical protein C1Y40_04127 [Mycobacterium talmoniae]|uniref:Uncharacterized protein n=1 Tax=Mycobacterium talmoniae TaxID=1858794 RepID=A0A2S8BG88_9MYCO|nr:hypothetical protein C1Y40_04127 [Mycobacterium talmoniae]